MTSCAASSSLDCHFTCPSGGTWYACTSAPFFVGCCSIDPCANTESQGCPEEYLAPASFDTSIADKFVPNDCVNNEGLWYTCSDLATPFLGCCTINPCQNEGCPSTDLRPAAWSQSRKDQLNLFLDGASSTTATTTTTQASTSTSTSSSTGTDATHVPSSPASSPATVHSAKSSMLPTGAIAGIAVGGAAVLGILFALFFLYRRRQRKRQVQQSPPEEQRAFTGQYAYNSPKSPYQDSQLDSPNPINPNSKYASGFSEQTTLSSSPPMSIESYRPISEIYTRSDDYARENQGLHISGISTSSQGLSELGGDGLSGRPDMIHELDGR